MHTRLLCDGEVERGRDRGTISIDCCDFHLVVRAESQVSEKDRVHCR